MAPHGGTLAGLTLDVGNTLLFPFPSLSAVYEETARACDLALPDDFGERCFASAWSTAQESRRPGLVYGTSDEEALDFWVEVNERLFAGRCVDGEQLRHFVGELYRRFSHGDVWRIAAELEGLLAACRRNGIRIGLLSNWDVRLRGILTELNLLTAVDAVTISSEHGVEKPDRRIFRIALSALGTKAENTLHVGDSWADDVVGALSAGLSAAWLTADRTDRGPGLPGVRIIHSLAEVMPLLG